MNRIAELRNQHGLSQVELSKFLGIAQNTLSQYENERRKIDTMTVMKLSDRFGVSANYILGLPEQKVPLLNKCALELTNVTRITVLCEKDDVNTYLDLGWKLIHIGQRTIGSENGIQSSDVFYTLGWYGDPREAPIVDPGLSARRNIDYLD